MEGKMEDITINDLEVALKELESLQKSIFSYAREDNAKQVEQHVAGKIFPSQKIINSILKALKERITVGMLFKDEEE
jgi:hypothetical protein